MDDKHLAHNYEKIISMPSLDGRGTAWLKLVWGIHICMRGKLGGRFSPFKRDLIKKIYKECDKRDIL